MSLSARDRQALEAIETELAGSDPKLSSMLNAFTRLTAGEDMPGPQRMRHGPARALRLPQVPGLRRRRRTGRAHWCRACLLLWLVISLALITVAVILARASPGTCAHASAPACAVHAAGPAARHPVPPRGSDLRHEAIGGQARGSALAGKGAVLQVAVAPIT